MPSNWKITSQKQFSLLAAIMAKGTRSSLITSMAQKGVC
jgi:hypothetical protein